MKVVAVILYFTAKEIPEHLIVLTHNYIFNYYTKVDLSRFGPYIIQPLFA